NAHNSAPSPVWWEPGDYLKLRTLYIHYDMKFKEMNMCLFLRGLNLFTLDGIEMEPEYVSTGGPQTRTYQIGVKCSF
ncbi:MAG: hypothetical protein HUJ91_04760, partial [Bacteroidales bacterium]|nr:hypothetical protein [Bacteroidales bacterium]